MSNAKNQMLRWLLLPFVAVIVFFVSAILGSLIAALFGVWYEPFIGFIAAAFVVTATSLTAPRFEKSVAILTYLLGVLVAWYLVGRSYFPESYARAYEPTYIPLIATYIGGSIGVIISIYLIRKISKRHTLCQTPFVDMGLCRRK